MVNNADMVEGHMQMEAEAWWHEELMWLDQKLLRHVEMHEGMEKIYCMM